MKHHEDKPRIPTTMTRRAIVALIAGVSSPALAQDAAAPVGLADIIVTATKREENLQRVPISVTAITAETIQNSRITNVGSLSSLAPNLTVVQGGGGSSIPYYSVRGVLASNSSPGADNGVSLYVDGVYIARPNGSLFDMADIERIEVLKGPQGTVFGRNSTGGAVSIITRQPSGEFGVRQDLGIGNRNQFRSKTRLDLPSFGPFSVTATYFHDQRRGDIRNKGEGQTYDYGPGTNGLFGKTTSPRWLGSSNTDGVQAKIRFDDGGSFNTTYKFDYTDTTYTPLGTTTLGFGDATFESPEVAAGIGFVRFIFADQPNQASLSPFTNKRPKAVNNGYTDNSRLKVWGHLLTSNLNVGENVSFRNILAYRASKVSDYTQLDGAGGLVVTPNIAGALGLPQVTVGSPITILGVNVFGKEHQWSEELQMNVTTDWFNVISGLYYFTQNLTTGGHGTKQIASFSFNIGGVVPGPVVPPSRLKARSIAIYSQATFHLTDRLDAVGGLRLTKDKKAGVDVTGAAPSAFDYRDDRPTWNLGLNFQATPSILTYVKASTGYISGGRLGGLDYRPESARSYEGGIKADLFDRRVRANLAAFYVKYQDLQFSVLGPTGGIGYQNAGRSRAWGGEAELTYQPFAGLTLQANGGYTNFKYTEIGLPGRTVENFVPIIRPKVTLSGIAQYESEPMIAGGRLLARAEANYRTKYNLNYQLVPGLNLVSPGTLILNGRIGLTEIPVRGGRLQIAAWGRNLTDRKQVQHLANLTLLYSVIFEQARSFGLEMSAEF